MRDEIGFLLNPVLATFTKTVFPPCWFYMRRHAGPWFTDVRNKVSFANSHYSDEQKNEVV
jgi:hypothetical protein